MSMTIQTQIKGITNLSLMMEAFVALGIDARLATPGKRVRGHNALAVAKIHGKNVAIFRSRNGNLGFVGDSDWKILKYEPFLNRLRQQYGLAAVKQKANELDYRIETVNTQEDGTIQVVARAWR